MDTVLIYSHCGKEPSLDTLNMAHISNYLAQKQGYKTILYIESKYKDCFNNIPYSEVVEFDDKILEQFPAIVWSAGKILAASMETRPFLHIDFDLFILNNTFYDFIKDEEFITYHFEPWWHVETEIGQKFNKKAIKYFLKKTKGAFNIKHSEKLGSYNFAIFGSCKKENIKIINGECKSVIEAIIKSKDILDDPKFIKFISKHSFGETGVTVIVEQVLTIAKIANRLNSHYQILKVKDSEDTFTEGIKFGLLHLWGSKHSEQILKQLKKKIKMLKLIKCK